MMTLWHIFVSNNSWRISEISKTSKINKTSGKEKNDG